MGVFYIWHDYEKKGLPEEMEIKPDKIINNNQKYFHYIERGLNANLSGYGKH